MDKKQIKLWILHAGLGHPSPYFYNLCNEFEKYKNVDVIVRPELPINIKTNNGIIYFNRLKRYYNSDDINSITKFLKKVDILKQNGWKLIFTLHNFFPIDRKINENDDFLLKNFLIKMDLVFTFTDYMNKSLKTNFGVNAITHSIGLNTLNNSFDKIIEIPSFKSESFVFTFVGNISKYKMLEEVIKCFKKINDVNAYLIIAGPENSKYKLEYKDDNNIIRINEFIGDDSWKKLSDITNIFINSYDITRECFKYGFFPSNCVQIMRLKKLCIVPQSDVMNEILPKGYYYTYKNNKDLFKIMQDVMKRKEEIKLKEISYPNSNYSWERMVNIIINSIEEM